MKRGSLFMRSQLTPSQAINQVKKIIKAQKEFYELLSHQAAQADFEEFKEISRLHYLTDLSSFQNASSSVVFSLLKSIVMGAILQEFTMYEELLDSFSNDIDRLYIRLSIYEQYIGMKLSRLGKTEERLKLNDEKLKADIKKSGKYVKSIILRSCCELLRPDISAACNKFFNKYLDIVFFKNGVQVGLNGKFDETNQRYAKLFLRYSRIFNDSFIYYDFDHKNKIIMKYLCQDYEHKSKSQQLRLDERVLILFNSYLAIYCPYEAELLQQIQQFKQGSNSKDEVLVGVSLKSEVNGGSEIFHEAEIDYALVGKQLSEGHKQLLQAVFDLDRDRPITLKELISLAYAFGAKIKPPFENRLGIELNDIYSELLVDDKKLTYENVSNAPNYLIEQFKAACERSGYTPQNLCSEDQTDQKFQMI